MQVSDDDDRNIAQRHRFGRFGVTASDTCRPAEPHDVTALRQRAHETRRASRAAGTVTRLVLWLVLVLATCWRHFKRKPKRFRG